MWAPGFRSTRQAALICLVATSLVGCATLQKTYDDVMAGPPSEEEMGRFYVSANGTPLYEEAGFSSAKRATLDRGETVDRDRIDHGFAHVVVVSTGLAGWVDNAKLSWKPPSAPSETKPNEPNAAPRPTATPAANAAAAPTPGPASREDAASAQGSAQPATANGEDEKPVDPALFDAF